MNNSVTGLAIGSDSYNAQQAVATAWFNTYGATFVTRPQAEQRAMAQALALQMAQITGNADITHMPGFDRITYDPTTGAGLDRPIPALAFQQDNNATFIALWLKTGVTATAWTLIGTGSGGGAVVPPFYEKIPSKDGGAGSPGVTNTMSHGDHQHPQEDPAEASSYLYPALIPDQLLRPPAKYVVAYQDPTHDLVPYGLDFSEWTPVPGVSTWKYNYAYPLYGATTTQPFYVTLNQGDRFLVLQDFSQPDIDTSPYLGIYELVHQYDANSNAIIRRTADANTPTTFRNGVTAQVSGDADADGYGRYYTFVMSDPVRVDVDYVYVDSSTDYTPNLGYELLTSSQLLTEGADNTSTLYTWAEASTGGPGADSFLGPFHSIVGTPGVATLPAGTYGFQLEGVTVNALGSTGHTATVQAKLLDIDNGGATILTAYSPPLVQNLTPTNVAFQANLAAPYAFSPTRRLALSYSLTSTADPPGMEVLFQYSSPTRGTWVKLPVSLAVGLTTVPAGNVTPGLLQTGLQVVTTVGGIIPPATNNNILITVDNILTVNGMSTAGLISGTILWLTFANACWVKNGATVGAGQAPFWLGNDYADGINWNGLTPHTLGSITVKYFEAGAIPPAPCFKLVGGPYS